MLAAGDPIGPEDHHPDLDLRQDGVAAPAGAAAPADRELHVALHRAVASLTPAPEVSAVGG
ncbi:hypothetical protein GA0115240_140653 [Streptomyces sp. DvalAA-14]|uniref:hypothetical protein n=1 Tax=unclassified Streptomyces TaxID=2593676 RepID=UPI00081BB4A2|nr:MULTISPECIES: hypothetical protein [unclassified Streptomyces]SCE14744.1 hypothetical protein GA0115240_140653 [Streptomyces sp. DvalAA-14]